MAAPKHRNICYTVNADGERPLLLLDELHPTWQHVKYNVYQRELGSHEHFQGYLELTIPKTYEALHDLEGLETAHFEKRRGTAKQARHYCMKEDSSCECNICIEERSKPTYVEGPWEFGEVSHQGQRADLMEIQRELDTGVSLKRIARDHFAEFIKFHRAFASYRRLTTEPRDFKPFVMLVVGPPGTGKTRFAYNLARYLGTMYKVPEKHTGFWCDDYDGQNVFFIDEMDGNRCTPTFFNGMIDRHEFIVPAHGSAGHQLIARFIIICSNYLPKYWWKKRSLIQQKQTTRRIDVTIKFVPPVAPVAAPIFRYNGKSRQLADFNKHP